MYVQVHCMHVQLGTLLVIYYYLLLFTLYLVRCKIGSRNCVLMLTVTGMHAIFTDFCDGYCSFLVNYSVGVKKNQPTIKRKFHQAGNERYI